MTDQLTEGLNLDGFVGPTGRKIDEAQVNKYLRLIDNADRLSPGRLHARFEEAVGQADFPILTQYVTQRELVSRYKTVIADWLPIVKTEYADSFITNERMWTTGINGLLPEQAEGQERHEVYQSELKVRRQIKKYGAKYKVTFEAQVNDVIGALRDMPSQFADACRFTEAYKLAECLVSASGLNTTLFSDTARAPFLDENGAVVTDARNPTVDNLLDASHDALSLEHLKLAIKQMAAMEAPVDRAGTTRRMGLRAKYLIVPPALELEAQEILNSTQVIYAGITGTTPAMQPAYNAVSNYGLQLVVNEAIPMVNTAASGDTCWFLAADPARGSSIRHIVLRGFENPQIFMKASNKSTVGGGSLGAYAGDFDTDDMQYAVRHIFHFMTGDPRYMIGSLGDTA